jgi:hypothetical protein
MSANIPVLRRLRPETWLDLHCVGDHAVLSTVFSSVDQTGAIILGDASDHVLLLQ